MWNVRPALEVSQTVFATAICLYFVGAQSKQVETRKRNTTPFIWLLAAMLLVSAADSAVLIVRAGGMPDIQPMAAALLYMLALLLQIDHLWPCTAEEKEEEKPAWHAYVGSWTAMAVFDILAIVELALTPPSSKFDLVCGAVATSLRCCLEFALFIVFARSDRGGYIWLGDDVEMPPDADAAAAVEDGNDEEGGKKLGTAELRHSVGDEIRAAGGRWPWLKKFHIFLPWIWPSGLPWMKLRIVAALVLMSAQMALTLYMPHIDGAFVESVVRAYADRDPSPVWPALALLMAVRLADSGYGLDGLQQLLWQKFKLYREQQARTDIYAYLMGHEAAFHNAADPTDVTLAVSRGVAVCEALDFIVRQMVPQVITLVGAITTVFSLYGAHVALVEGTVVVLNTIVVRRSNRLLIPMYDARITARQEAERRHQGGLRAWRTVALHSQTDGEIEAYATSLATQIGLTWKSYLFSLAFGLSSSIVVNAGQFAATALVVLYGLQTGGTVGPVVAFGGYWGLLQGPLLFIARIPERVFRDLYTADRLRRLLEFKPTMTYGTEDLHLVGGGVELKNVKFSYPGANAKAKPVFDKLNLSIKPGRITAIVGASGVGKSTLLHLITRVHDPDEGSVEIDCQDVKTLKKGGVLEHASVMEQNPHIFNDTVINNIRYGRPDATVSEAHNAAERAGIHAGIMARDKQYDAQVGEGGGNLSGGERQRVSLARAFVSQRHLVLYDEPTSALDADTEAHVNESIETCFPNQTVVIIAHRLSSIMHADSIVVLKVGKGCCGEIGEEGTHDELLARNGIYAGLWKRHTGAAESKEKTNQTARETSIEGLFDNEER
ncbi:MAG: hypothetical protein M1819_000807 [Sarea resinae]|nr:MAG: hypothetical protein M1819_000807 [Sarea resinae]